MRNCTKLLRVWSVLCLALQLAVTGLTVLSATGCRSHRVLSRESVEGSVLSAVSTGSETVVVERRVTAAGVDSVELRVPIETMRMLPDGGEFSQRQGGTRVTLRREGSVLTARAETTSAETTSEVRSARREVRGTGYEVRGTRCEVRGAGYVVRGGRRVVAAVAVVVVALLVWLRCRGVMRELFKHH